MVLACVLIQGGKDTAMPSRVYFRGSGLVLVNNSFGWVVRGDHAGDNEETREHCGQDCLYQAFPSQQKSSSQTSAWDYMGQAIYMLSG